MNTSKYVLDSYALMAFFGKERGWERVLELLTDANDGKIELHISLINLAEVQYTVIRRTKDPALVLAALESLPLKKASADPHIPQVVTLKARHLVSLADCFAAALALDLECPVITGDAEFHKLEAFISVEWL